MKQRDETDSPSVGERKARALQDLAAIDARQAAGGAYSYRRVREDDHIEADEILLRLIDDDDIRQVFERIEK